MRAVYPVLFTKTDANILIEVPDMEILTEGTDMNNAIEMARDAIELTCISLEDEGEEIPKPSEMLDVNSGTFSGDGATIVSFVDIDSSEYRRKVDTKVVRKNVSLPSWLNYEADKAGINVSRVLQEALVNVLGVTRSI